MKLPQTIFIILLTIIGSIITYTPSLAQQVEKVSPDGTKYWLYTPSSPYYSPSIPAPLLVCLHGGSAIGDDLNDLTLNTSHQTPPKLISLGQWPASRPFIVVSPQLKKDSNIPKYNDQEWPAILVDEVIEHVRSTYNVDANRIYLTGISLGGAGCWDYAAAYPNKVAALLPFSGKTRIANACLVKNIPTWVFHGEDDGLVIPQFSIDMVNAVNACVPAGAYKPFLKLLHNRGHEGWSEVYNGANGYNVFDWLLQFSKNDLTNKPPYVTAGIDQSILLQSESINLPVKFFDSDGTIQNFNWTQISGPTLTLDQSNSNYLKLSNLVAGTFEFELVVTDNLNAQNSDRIILQILPSLSATEAAVTSLTLTNGNGTIDIGNITEGMVINKNTLNTSSFNIRATANSNTASVRFRINSDQAVSNTNNPGPYYITKTNQPWGIPNGEYTICATAYIKKGAQGDIGVSRIFKITVIDQPVSAGVFYSKTGTDISLLTSWGVNTDGSGTNPASFTSPNQTFNIGNTVNLNNPLSITGTGSVLWVRSSGQLTLNSGLTAPINAEAGSTINVNTNQPLSLGTISSSTTFNFGLNATSIPALQYGNLILSGSGSIKTLSSGTTQVLGNLTIANNVTVNASTSIISIAGNWTNNNGSFSSGTGTANFNGTTNQIITGATTFNNLTVSKSNGTLNLAGTGPTTINNTLALTTGKIIPSLSNTLALTLTGSITGGSQTSFIAGPMTKVLSSGGTFVFPVGNISANRYRPFTLENTSAQDTWSGEFIANDPSADGYSHLAMNATNLGSISQYEYWNISRVGSTFADLTVSYGAGSYQPPNIGTLSNLRIAHWNGTQWDLPTGSGSLSGTGDNITGTIKVTHVTSFSPHTIGSISAISPLPVKWTYLNAKRLNNAIEIRWATATEYNNDYFEMQRAVDGKNFTTLMKVKGAGNSKVSNQYHHLDSEVSDDKTYYYRIRQVDYDGADDFSSILAVPAIGKSNVRWALFPNPINDQQQFHLILLDKSIDEENIIKAEIVSLNGFTIALENGLLNDVSNRLENLVHQLSPGIYMIHLSDGNYREHFRIARY